MEARACQGCGTLFTPAYSTAKYCSQACYHTYRTPHNKRQSPPMYMCATCGASFTSNNPRPKYCSKSCKDSNPERRAWFSALHREIPDQPCVVCGTMFRPTQRGVECCSFKCSRLKIQKHDWPDHLECEVCGKPLTRRQITGGGRVCSRKCHGRLVAEWYTDPDHYAIAQARGVAAIARNQTAPTKIELALAAALDRAGITYIAQFQVCSRSTGQPRFLCDFYLPDSNIIVEADGDYWHHLPNVQSKDKRKDAYLKACGYTVLHFTETQIKQDVEACVHVIQASLPTTGATSQVQLG